VNKVIRILIIDDDAQVVGTLLEFIGMIDHDSIHCDYAHEALKAQALTSANSYQLIITDYHMPFQNGLSFVKALRAHKGPNQQTEVLMISGFVEAIDPAFDEIENFSLIEKPLSFASLEKRIRALKSCA